MTITRFDGSAETVNSDWLCLAKNLGLDDESDSLTNLDPSVFQAEFDYLFLKSGVAVHCGDFGSSNSDITEPCSPLSTSSLEEMPPTSQPTLSGRRPEPTCWPPWPPGDVPEPAAKRRKQGQEDDMRIRLTEDCEAHQLDLFETPPPSGEDTSCHGTSSDRYPDTYEDSTSSASIVSSKADDDDEDEDDEGCADVTSLFARSSSSSSASSSSAKQEERTIRFPKKDGWNGHCNMSDVVCRWTGCETRFATTAALLEHLQKIHVDGQTLEEFFICKWTDCKVYDRKSCSRTWLDRHVLSHGGSKRFACIVDGCGQRFNSQVLLTRHVNNHFAEGKQDSKKGCETNNKLIRRNGKKLRYRREPFTARTEDFIDTGIMEGIQYNLFKIAEKKTLGLFDAGQVPADSFALKSEIVGRRTDNNGTNEVLVRWFPKNIIQDEWMDPTKVERTRTIKMSTLPPESKDCLFEYLWGHQTCARPPRRRKQAPAPPFSPST
ncbi:metal ion Hypothetical protein [Nesidiocoris tenuis]|uniref:C2H2-type domain-containing protein n=2 Tax=Nesidiocoris tenuis TaxID=355587 RepID=A0ABN7B543_9HEMI|nr:metal ion Hypothetical protein [Nesidiocoris tenuis]